MTDNNIEGEEDDDVYTYDDPVVSWAEPADEIAFARLERQDYTIVRDADGKAIAAIHPDSVP